MPGCEKCGAPTHRDDAMNVRCNDCERIVRLCDCKGMGYRVVKISRQLSCWQGQTEPSYEHVILSDAGNRDSALVLAEVACSEHADGIDVKYVPCGNMKEQTGYTFRTNNGTDVWYVVKAND